MNQVIFRLPAREVQFRLRSSTPFGRWRNHIAIKNGDVDLRRGGDLPPTRVQTAFEAKEPRPEAALQRVKVEAGGSGCDRGPLGHFIYDAVDDNIFDVRGRNRHGCSFGVYAADGIFSLPRCYWTRLIFTIAMSRTYYQLRFGPI